MQVGGIDGEAHAFAFRHFLRHLAHDVGDLALEVPDTGFTRIVGDDLTHRRLGDADMFLGDAVFVELPGNQIFLGDAQLLFFGIAGDPDHFHPVAQGGQNGVDQIRRCNEHHFGQVEGHAQVVVRERVVLFRVEHFEQGCGGVAAKIHPDLVDFVQHEDRVVGAGLFHALNDAAGQRADVGASMTADLGFITDAAKTDADKFARPGRGRSTFPARSSRRPGGRRSRGSGPSFCL